MKEEAMRAKYQSKSAFASQSTPATKMSTISAENDDKHPKSILSQSKKNKDQKQKEQQQLTQSAMLDIISMEDSVIYFSEVGADKNMCVKPRMGTNSTNPTYVSRKEMPPMQVYYTS